MKIGPLGKGLTTLIFCREGVVKPHRYRADYDQIDKCIIITVVIAQHHFPHLELIPPSIHYYGIHLGPGTGSRVAHFFTLPPHLFMRNRRPRNIEAITRGTHCIDSLVSLLEHVICSRAQRRVTGSIASPRIRSFALEPHPKQDVTFCTR